MNNNIDRNILMLDMMFSKINGSPNVIAVTIMIMRMNKVVSHETIYLECDETIKWLKSIDCNNTISIIANSEDMYNYFAKIIKNNKNCEIWTDWEFDTQTKFLENVIKNDSENIMFEKFRYIKYIFPNYMMKMDYRVYFNEKLFEIYPQLADSKKVKELIKYDPLYRCSVNLYALTDYMLTDERVIIDYYVNNKLFKYK